MIRDNGLQSLRYKYKRNTHTQNRSRHTDDTSKPKTYREGTHPQSTNTQDTHTSAYLNLMRRRGTEQHVQRVPSESKLSQSVNNPVRCDLTSGVGGVGELLDIEI